MLLEASVTKPELVTCAEIEANFIFVRGHDSRRLKGMDSSLEAEISSSAVSPQKRGVCGDALGSQALGPV